MANTLWCLRVGREEGGAQVIPIIVTFKRAGFVCHFEMLGLRIQNEGDRRWYLLKGNMVGQMSS